jgi:hypothetical protein
LQSDAINSRAVCLICFYFHWFSDFFFFTSSCTQLLCLLFLCFALLLCVFLSNSLLLVLPLFSLSRRARLSLFLFCFYACVCMLICLPFSTFLYSHAFGDDAKSPVHRWLDDAPTLSMQSDNYVSVFLLHFVPYTSLLAVSFVDYLREGLSSRICRCATRDREWTKNYKDNPSTVVHTCTLFHYYVHTSVAHTSLGR